MSGIHITATLAPCPECKEVMVLMNGAVQSDVTFWTKGQALSMMTPHSVACPLRGKALP